MKFFDEYHPLPHQSPLQSYQHEAQGELALSKYTEKKPMERGKEEPPQGSRFCARQ